MGIDRKTGRELDELLKKINKFEKAIKDFEKDLPRLKKTLAYHKGQQKRYPSGVNN